MNITLLSLFVDYTFLVVINGSDFIVSTTLIIMFPKHSLINFYGVFGSYLFFIVVIVLEVPYSSNLFTSTFSFQSLELSSSYLQ